MFGMEVEESSPGSYRVEEGIRPSGELWQLRSGDIIMSKVTGLVLDFEHRYWVS